MVICDCGYPTHVRTSWTNNNPGYKLWVCSWLDKEICTHSKQVIPGLLRSKNLFEAELSAKILEARRWKLMFISSWHMVRALPILKSFLIKLEPHQRVDVYVVSKYHEVKITFDYHMIWNHVRPPLIFPNNHVIGIVQSINAQ
ncbi:hypothetical protein OSB04_000128 [Centaurea solstitialis]|uniref:Uncharacterized protein n=1 Tax=Centaurea solstitialis TaxID=347529 RepID=A0AA38U6S1_9ASTR|nr:hypothetical protein OSB04_000128 [Centaurea solstitialis]